MKLPLCAAVIAALLAVKPAHAICPDAGEVDIYPTAKLLPENILRLYVYYPRTMKVDDGLRHVQRDTQLKACFLPVALICGLQIVVG